MASSGTLRQYSFLRSAKHRNRSNLQNFVEVWATNRTSTTSLDIFTKMLNFAHGIGATVDDINHVISGEKRYGFVINPFSSNFGKPTPRGKYSTVGTLRNRPHGFNETFGDPDPNNNQVHHTWYYTQLTYNNSNELIPLAGNYYHEYIQEADGQSDQDYLAGLYGIKVGFQLKNGEVTLQELATQMRTDLGP